MVTILPGQSPQRPCFPALTTHIIASQEIKVQDSTVPISEAQKRYKGYVLKHCVFSAATVGSSTLHANKTEQVPTSTSPNPSCFPLWDYEDGHLFTTGSVIPWYDGRHRCIENDQAILFFIATIVWSQNDCHSSSHQTGESFLKQETQGSEGSSLSTGKRNWGFHWKGRNHRICYIGSSHVPLSGDF